jgi:hypothetical protein
MNMKKKFCAVCVRIPQKRVNLTRNEEIRSAGSMNSNELTIPFSTAQSWLRGLRCFS